MYIYNYIDIYTHLEPNKLHDVRGQPGRVLSLKTKESPPSWSLPALGFPFERPWDEDGGWGNSRFVAAGNAEELEAVLESLILS